MSHGAEPDTTLPLIDTTAVADWCADLDKEDIAAILSQVPEQCTFCMDEIAGAVGAGDLTKAKRMAHRLKGMAANLGATRLSRLARSIEMEAGAIGDVELHLAGLRTTIDATLAELATLH